MTPEEIAASLTAEQRAALLWLPADGSSRDRGVVMIGQQPTKDVLYELGNLPRHDAKERCTLYMQLCERDREKDASKEFDEHWRAIGLGLRVRACLDAARCQPPADLRAVLTHCLLMGRNAYATPEAQADGIIQRLAAEGFSVSQELPPEWRPPGTAPTDGTEFLARLSNGWRVILWAHLGIKRGDRFSWWVGNSNGGRVPYEPSFPDNSHWSDTTLRLTGWMPLPD